MFNKTFFILNIQSICRLYSIQIELKQGVVLRKLIHGFDKFVWQLSGDPIWRKLIQLNLKKKYFSFPCLVLIISNNKSIFIG